MNRSILVTGATGQQGGAVAKALIEARHEVRGLTRNPDSDRAIELKALGVEIVQGDFDKPETVRAAAAEVDAAFVMGTPFEEGPAAETRQGIAVLEALVDAQVRHIVYTSVASAHTADVPHFDSKARVERHLETLEVEHTVLAPVAYLDNLESPWVAPGLKQGSYAFMLPADVPLQQVALADIASFAALVFDQPERFRGQRIELASVEVTGSEVASVLTERLGHAIEYVELPAQGDDDILRMLEFFRRDGYSVDIAKLHATYPEIGWHSLGGWVRGHDWSAVTG